MTDEWHWETFRLEIRKSLSPHKDSKEMNRLPREMVVSHARKM